MPDVGDRVVIEGIYLRRESIPGSYQDVVAYEDGKSKLALAHRVNRSPGPFRFGDKVRVVIEKVGQ